MSVKEESKEGCIHIPDKLPLPPGYTEEDVIFRTVYNGTVLRRKGEDADIFFDDKHEYSVKDKKYMYSYHIRCSLGLNEMMTCGSSKIMKALDDHKKPSRSQYSDKVKDILICAIRSGCSIIINDISNNKNKDESKYLGVIDAIDEWKKKNSKNITQSHSNDTDRTNNHVSKQEKRVIDTPSPASKSEQKNTLPQIAQSPPTPLSTTIAPIPHHQTQNVNVVVQHQPSLPPMPYYMQQYPMPQYYMPPPPQYQQQLPPQYYSSQLVLPSVFRITSIDVDDSLRSVIQDTDAVIRIVSDNKLTAANIFIIHGQELKSSTMNIYIPIHETRTRQTYIKYMIKEYGSVYSIPNCEDKYKHLYA